MSSTATLPRHQLNTYFHDNSILFQFILHEFLRAYSEGQNIRYFSLGNFPSETSNFSEIEKQVHELIEKLNVFSSSPQDQLWHLPWNFDLGILTRLKNYSYLLARNAETTDDPLLYNLHDQFHKGWLNCKQMLDAIANFLLPSHPHFRNKDHLLEIDRNLRKLKSHIQLQSRLIVNTLMQFQQDENVIFFILRHHRRFIQVFGVRYLQQLIQRLFPEGGMREMQQLLTRCYSLRGFDHMVPVINEKIHELEKELA